MIGIVFKEPISVSGMSGVLKLTSNLLINNLSYYKASPIELQQKATQLLWSEIAGSVIINTQTPTGTTNITIATASNHGFVVGQQVTISDVVPSGYNGTWTTQTGTTGSTLVVNIGSNPGTITSAGTVIGNYWATPIPTQTPTVSVKQVTLTTSNNHKLFLSEKVSIRNLVPTEYNTTADSYVTAIPSATSFRYLATSATAPSGAITTAGIALGTWEYSSIPNYFEIYSNNIKDIYKTLTGTNKSIVDSNYEYQGLRLGGYEYLGYLNVEFSEITLDIL